MKKIQGFIDEIPQFLVIMIFALWLYSTATLYELVLVTCLYKIIIDSRFFFVSIYSWHDIELYWTLSSHETEYYVLDPTTRSQTCAALGPQISNATVYPHTLLLF